MTGTAVARYRPQETEAGWLGVVVDLARVRGWLVYHTHDSRHSAAGFPDLVLVRAGRLVFAELKRNARTERAQARQVTADQAAWLAALGDVKADAVEVYVWRPVDWPSVVQVLT